VRRLVQALPVLVLLVALPLAWASVRDRDRDGDEPVVPASMASVGVTDDDGGEPLFALAALSPGRSITRCIRVRFGGDEAGAVRLAGRVDGSTLASRVFLVVERGTGGDFDGCRGFSGDEVFSGTLAEFARDEGGRAWRAEDGEASTYRFTATAAADLPERPDRAAATFTWQATALPGDGDGPGDEPGPGGDEPPVHAGTPGGVPGTPGGGPAAAPSGIPGGDPAGGPGSRGGSQGDGPGGPGAAGGPGGADAAAGPLGSGIGAGAGKSPQGTDHRSVVRRVVDAIRDVAVDAGKRAAFPMVLILLIGVFLTAQHRIDQRDPKLALAPVHREIDLPFTPLRLPSGVDGAGAPKPLRLGGIE
jgi:hypothetical protein